MTDYIANVIALDGDLEQSGVKGMKWGVRKDVGHEGEQAKARTIARADKKYDKQFKGMAGFVKIHNEMANNVNKRIDAMNSKYPDNIDLRDPKNSKIATKYYNDYKNVLEDSMAEAMTNFGVNASGTKRVRFVITGEGENTYYEARMDKVDPSELQQDDMGNQVLRVTPEFDSQGRIVGQTIAMVDPTLEHSGVKGMKWGVRKKDAPSSTPTTKAPAGESNTDRYNRLLAHAKKHGANTLDDDDLKFVTLRGDAISKVNRLNQTNPGWVSSAANQALKQAAKKTLQMATEHATKKYITDPLLGKSKAGK